MVDGSGTALMLALLTPPPSETDEDELAEPALSKLPPDATNELDGINEPASAKLLAIGLPLESDGASVNVEPAPITSEVWLMWLAVRLAPSLSTTLPPVPESGSTAPSC